MKYARIVNGVVLEILQPPAGYELKDCYHADIVNTCVEASDDVSIGWTYDPTHGFVNSNQGATDGGQVDSGSNQEAGVTQEATGGTSGQEDSVQGTQQGS